jgi:hypothetical protein
MVGNGFILKVVCYVKQKNEWTRVRFRVLSRDLKIFARDFFKEITLAEYHAILLDS